ncbi:MAG: FMN-dependent NADH-azoreductase [Planctomycetota bacterium]
MRILYLIASPRLDSYSKALADAFLERFRQVHDDVEVDAFDLFRDNLPAFTAPSARAKYAVMGGSEPVDDAGRAWRDVIAVVERLKAAELLLIAAPMWNFSIPYTLKQWIDVIVQPGLTFNYDADTGYTGLITGRPAVLALARGGDYSPGSPTAEYDMQRPYLREILRFIGFEDIRPVIVQPTLQQGPDIAAAQLDDALGKIRALAETVPVAPQRT